MATETRVLETANVEFAPFNSRNKDRVINANHLARWLSSTNNNGIARKFNEFALTRVNNLTVSIGTGVGFVDGHHIYLKESQTIELEPSNASRDRIDTIGYRLEVNERRVMLYYTIGELGSTTAPTPITEGDYIEIPLYNISVKAGISQLLDGHVQDVRQYVVSSATYFKPYYQTFTTTTAITSADITVPYNNNTDVVTITVNGILLSDTQYEINNKAITFYNSIYSGNEVHIEVWHFLDGSGSMDSLNTAIKQLEDVEKVKKYYYFCNGVNDNILLSDLAQNFLNDTSLDSNAQMEIVVCGNCGVSNNYSGDGTQSYPYTYFAFGRAATSTKTIYFNFANCSRISIYGNSGYSTIFSGADINIRNVAVNVEAGEHVDIFNGTNIHCQDSEFWMTTWGDCCVGRCCGYFDKVRTSITSTGGNAYCFYGNGRLLRVIGGDHYAWTADSSSEAVCFYVEAYQTENVMHVTMANCPESARSGYTQTRPIKINNGYATFMMNTLWMVATQANGSFYDATKCIASGNAIISKN